MKAILIDPHARTITEVEHDDGLDSPNGIYAHCRCDLVCTVNVAHWGRYSYDTLFLDDDGLSRPNQAFFTWGDYAHPLAGYGLILGCDDEGNSIAPRMTIDSVRQVVAWIAPEQARDRHHQAHEAAEKRAREIMCDHRGAFVIVAPEVDFPNEGSAS